MVSREKPSGTGSVGLIVSGPNLLGSPVLGGVFSGTTYSCQFSTRTPLGESGGFWVGRGGPLESTGTCDRTVTKTWVT